MRLDEIYTLCLQHNFSPDAAAIMAAIALAESGGNPNSECHSCAGVPENSIGLYQINMDSWPSFGLPCLKDPDCSTNAAYIVSNAGSDFSPWTQYKNGAYKKYYVPHGSIVGQSGQAVDTNPALKITHALGDSGAGQAVKNVAGKGSGLINGVKNTLGLGASVSPDDLKNSLIAISLLGIAGVLIIAGVYGLVQQPAREIITTAAKVGAL
jgi:hypothetical protein